MIIPSIFKRAAILTAAALAVLVPVWVEAQSVVLDEGSFEISIDGRRAGTEEFSIRRSGVGPNAQTIATAEITLSVPEGRLDMRPALQVIGRGITITAYQTKVSGAREEEVFVTAADGRFLLRMRSDRGEQERELRAVPGTLIIDRNVAHQHYFITHRMLEASGSIAVMIPGEGRQYQVTVTEVGEEQVQVGGRTLQSRHLQLTTGSETRDLWVDADGRVLRVTDPASGYSAIRTRPPG